MVPNAQIFTLNNFEGPLDLLWHLVNRQEVDICQVSILELTKQYNAKSQEFHHLDWSAEFIALAATLAWSKSRALLPKHDQGDSGKALDEEADPHFEIIHQLIDYCHFKKVAKELAEREQQQEAFYPRGVGEVSASKKNLGIEHLSLDDLAILFQQILAKSSSKKGTIQEEEWKVSDKIDALQEMLNIHKTLLFTDLFLTTMSRQELIVAFLALLEMMKIGEARVIKGDDNQIYILAPQGDHAKRD